MWGGGAKEGTLWLFWEGRVGRRGQYPYGEDRRKCVRRVQFMLMGREVYGSVLMIMAFHPLGCRGRGTTKEISGTRRQKRGEERRGR